MRQKGFTLVELMIVAAIIAILSAIVYPAYKDQLRQGRRADAQSILQDLALQQERWRNNDTDYATLAELNARTSSWYTFTVPTNTATAFTIQAAASGDQAKDKEASTSCATLTINQANTRTPAACW